MLGEISAIARASGITTLQNEVAANAAHVSPGNTEFTAAAVKVSGPMWNGRDGPKEQKSTGPVQDYSCAAKGCNNKLTKSQSGNISLECSLPAGLT